MSAWVSMQAYVGIQIRRGFIASPTPVKGRIRILNENDDDDGDDICKIACQVKQCLALSKTK